MKDSFKYSFTPYGQDCEIIYFSCDNEEEIGLRSYMLIGPDKRLELTDESICNLAIDSGISIDRIKDFVKEARDRKKLSLSLEHIESKERCIKYIEQSAQSRIDSLRNMLKEVNSEVCLRNARSFVKLHLDALKSAIKDYEEGNYGY